MYNVGPFKRFIGESGKFEILISRTNPLRNALIIAHATEANVTLTYKCGGGDMASYDIATIDLNGAREGRRTIKEMILRAVKEKKFLD